MSDENSSAEADGAAQDAGPVDAGLVGAGSVGAAASVPPPPVLPPAVLPPPVLGMVGGGYRTRLTAQAAISLGIGFRVLAQAADDSAAQVWPSQGSMIGDYQSADDLLAFAAGCEVVTFEHEHVPEELLAKLDPSLAIRPAPATLKLVRDKAALRDWLDSLVLGSVGPGSVVPGSVGPGSVASGELLDSGRELAVIVARSPKGQGATYPVTAMLRRDGDRREFVAPARGLDPGLAVEAQRLALKIAAEFNLAGLLTVELVETGGELSISDLAATPHDAGLWTIDAAVTSQFEQYVRAVLDLPFGTTIPVAANAVTVTVLGGDDPDLFSRFVHVMAADPGARVHIYTNQPGQIRPGSRVGHVTVVGDDLERTRDRAWRAANYLGLGTEDPDEDPETTS